MLIIGLAGQALRRRPRVTSNVRRLPTHPTPRTECRGKPCGAQRQLQINDPVPLFKITVHASGIRLPNADGGPDIVGFYRVQKVWASSLRSAEQRALADIEHDWKAGARAGADQQPELKVEKSTQISFFQFLGHKNGGHVFYPEETDA